MSLHFPRSAVLILLATITATQAAPPRHEETVQELPYGVSLYHLFQGQNLAAITEISAARQRARLDRQKDDAELLLGSLYYDFGLADESEKIFQQMLAGDESPVIKNRVWFNLARVQYEKGNFSRAQDLLSRIDDSLSPQRKDQQYYMLSNIYSRQQQFPPAIEAVQKIDTDSPWSSYAGFNLGVELLKAQTDREWLQKLAGEENGSDEIRALQDNARYLLGLTALRENYMDQALQYFSRIHIDTPLSNKALLATGWAWYKKSDLRQALEYWQILRQKNAPDAATQEALIAMADAREKTGDKAQAINNYQQAAATYDQFLQQLDEVIENIKQQSFIDALLENKSPQQHTEIKKGQASTGTFLYALLSSNEFQQAVENYRQLLEMQQTLNHWEQNLPVFELMLAERKRTFQARQQQLDVEANDQRLQALQTSRDHYAEEVKRIEAEQDYRSLANEDEVDYLEQLEDINRLIEKLQATRDMSEARQKYRLMTGLLDYQLETEFPARYWVLQRQLQLLDRALDKAKQATRSLVLSAQQNELRLADFDQRIEGQQNLTDQQIQRVDRLLMLQRDHINKLAIAEIERRKQHTRSLRLSARYSAARLLDDLTQQSASQPGALQ
jgi:tetratricopeptide (TPR) repeat protein